MFQVRHKVLYISLTLATALYLVIACSIFHHLDVINIKTILTHSYTSINKPESMLIEHHYIDEESMLSSRDRDFFKPNTSNTSGYNTNRTKLYGWRDDITDVTALDKLAFEMMEYKAPIYTRTRAPCFYGQEKSLSSRKDQVIYNIITRLHCLPSIFLIGSCKSGTTDLYNYLTMHRHVLLGIHKEHHFWSTNKRLKPQFTMTFREYLRHYGNLSMLNNLCYLQQNKKSCKLAQQINLIRNMSDEINKISRNGRNSPFVSIDASVTYLDSTNHWQDDQLNKRSKEVLVFTPHRIQHFIPQAKILAILRNPVDRLVSDFYFFVEDTKKLNPDYLHTLVVNGIKWWNLCTKHLKESQCAFGISFSDVGVPDLPPGRFDWGDSDNYGHNGAARLRMGIYFIYIAKWQEVFDRNHMLVIQMERYSQNISHALTTEIIPFLELDPYLNTEWDSIHKETHALPKNANTKLQKKKGIHENTRKLLEDFYKPYNIRLAKLLDDSRFLWS